MLKKTIIILVGAIVLFIVFGVIVSLGTMSDLNKTVRGMCGAFEVGRQIGDFLVPKDKMVMIIFQKEGADKSVSIDANANTDECRVTSNDTLLETVQRDRIGDFILRNRNMPSEFNEMHVTVLRLGFPQRRSFTVYYSPDGTVTSITKPYAWD